VAFGGQSGGDVKRAGRTAMRSQLGQDLDATLDELHFQSELADASAAKLAALEEDRHSVVKAYNDRLASLESELTSARGALEEAEGALEERDGELAGAEGEAADLEQRRAALLVGLRI
jgi:chromosome segregation ATPase